MDGKIVGEEKKMTKEGEEDWEEEEESSVDA